MEVSEARRLEILLGNELRACEILSVWQCANPERQNYHPSSWAEINELLEDWHFELWRAKLRFENCSLTGLMDAHVHCARHGAALPRWLNQATASAFTSMFPNSVGNPSETFAQFPANPTWKKELKHLKRQTRVGMMVALLRRHEAWASEVQIFKDPRLAARDPIRSLKPGARSKRLPPAQTPYWYKYEFSDDVVRRANSSGQSRVNLYPRRMTKAKAAEIAEICLRGTTASGTAEEILRGYQRTVEGYGEKLKVQDLTKLQLENLHFDILAVTPETMRSLGLHTFSEIQNKVWVF